VPAPVSTNLISSFQVSKYNFGGGLKKKFLTLLSSSFAPHILSFIADHMNPANSLAAKNP
jgi:hypothetical protein